MYLLRLFLCDIMDSVCLPDLSDDYNSYYDSDESVDASECNNAHMRDGSNDVRNRFEHIRKLVREDSERVATEAMRENLQLSMQRSFERVAVWLNENKRKPMREQSTEETSIAQTWHTLCKRLQHGYNLPTNVAEGRRDS